MINTQAIRTELMNATIHVNELGSSQGKHGLFWTIHCRSPYVTLGSCRSLKVTLCQLRVTVDLFGLTKGSHYSESLWVKKGHRIGDRREGIQVASSERIIYVYNNLA